MAQVDWLTVGILDDEFLRPHRQDLPTQNPGPTPPTDLNRPLVQQAVWHLL